MIDIDADAELLTIGQVASRLHLRPRTVQAWVRLGRIPALRLTAKVVRFNWTDVVESLRVHAEKSAKEVPNAS
jgi:excisionase family DNA binding protein